MKKHHIGILLSVFVFLILCFKAFPHTTDDSYISFRYAVNFAEGRGLVFNTSERVEGYSNLLWVVILAGFKKLGFDIIITSKILGIASGIGVLLLTARLMRRITEQTVGVMTAGLLFLASSAGLVYYSIAGLETIFYVMLVLLCNVLLLEKRFFWAGVVASALIITRPEGMMFMAVIAVAVWLEENIFSRQFFKTFVNAISLPVLTLVGLMIFRVQYYGALTPNTHAAKVNPNLGIIGFLTGHSKGFLTYTTEMLTSDGFILMAAAFGVIYFLKKKYLPVVTSMGLLFFFIWYAGDDWMDFGRFYIPVLPFLTVFAFGAAGLFLKTRLKTARQYYLMLGLYLLPAIIAGAYTSRSIVHLFKNDSFNPAMSAAPHAAIGKFLKEYGNPGDSLAVNEIGAIGYYADDMYVTDMLGLTEKNVPALIHANDFDGYTDYILSLRPRFILLNDVQHNWDERLWEAVRVKMAQRGNYRELKRFQLSKKKALIVFEHIQ